MCQKRSHGLKDHCRLNLSCKSWLVLWPELRTSWFLLVLAGADLIAGYLSSAAAMHRGHLLWGNPRAYYTIFMFSQ